VLRAIVMYRMLLKKDDQFFSKFVNGLHMTGNGLVGNAVEVSAGLLEQGYNSDSAL
jgi:hypothetical protein